MTIKYLKILAVFDMKRVPHHCDCPVADIVSLDIYTVPLISFLLTFPPFLVGGLFVIARLVLTEFKFYL